MITFTDKEDISNILKWVYNHNKKSISFFVTDEIWNSMLLHIHMERWHTLACLYGYAFINTLKEYYMHVEDYNKCAAIQADIVEYTKNVNSLV